MKEARKESPTFDIDMGNITTNLNRYKDELTIAYQYLLMQKEEITEEKLRAFLDREIKKEPKVKPKRNEFYERYDEFIEGKKPFRLYRFKSLRSSYFVPVNVKSWFRLTPEAVYTGPSQGIKTWISTFSFHGNPKWAMVS